MIEGIDPTRTYICGSALNLGQLLRLNSPLYHNLCTQLHLCYNMSPIDCQEIHHLFVRSWMVARRMKLSVEVSFMVLLPSHCDHFQHLKKPIFCIFCQRWWLTRIDDTIVVVTRGLAMTSSDIKPIKASSHRGEDLGV